MWHGNIFGEAAHFYGSATSPSAGGGPLRPQNFGDPLPTQKRFLERRSFDMITRVGQDRVYRENDVFIQRGGAPLSPILGDLY